MVQRPADFGAFEFVILAALRAAQLMRGCTPRVDSGHKMITTAQLEVAERKVVRARLDGLVALVAAPESIEAMEPIVPAA